jgi:excisionase family DNA binding protein
MVQESRASLTSEASAEDVGMTLDNGQKWVDFHELARLVGVSYQTVLRYNREKRFQAIQVGGRWRVYREELERFLKEGNYNKW